MQINRACKTGIVHPSKDYLSRIMAYLPHRTECIENLREQLFPEEKPITSTVSSFQSNDGKGQKNIHAIMSVVLACSIMEKRPDCGLHTLSNKKASAEQEHDLLSSYQTGSVEFQKYIKHYILKESSVAVPQRKKKLATFAERKVNKSKVSQLEKDRKLMQKCLHKRLRHSIMMGQPMDTLVEQYIEVPLAIACNDGTPVRGQKSNVIQSRYGSVVPKVLHNSLPSGWIPECCILEGMFMINTCPLGSHKTFGEYGHFLIKRYIFPQYSRGTTEVHVIFDDYGILTQTPKHFEQKRRDTLAKVPLGHTCDTFSPQTSIPPHWRENVLNCRNCKVNLIQFLAGFFLQNISPHLSTNDCWWWV